MRQQVFVEQQSAEWHELRSLHIGASDVAAIMGDSPYTSRDRFITAKIRNEVTAPNFAMQRGHRLEEPSRQCFNRKYDCQAVPAVFKNDAFSWLMASLDGFDAEKGILFETKANGEAFHSMAKQNIVPKPHMWQLQTIMAVMDMDFICYCSYVSDEDHVYLWVKRDQELIDLLLAETKKAYDQVMAFELPDQPVLMESDEWGAAAARLKEVRQSIKNLEAEESALVDSLKTLAGNQPAYGKGIFLKKITKTGSINYKEIPELKGVDLDLYRSPSSYYFKIEFEKETGK